MLTSPFRYVKDTYMTLHLAYVTDSLLTWICFLLSFFVLLCFGFSSGQISCGLVCFSLGVFICLPFSTFLSLRFS